MAEKDYLVENPAGYPKEGDNRNKADAYKTTKSGEAKDNVSNGYVSGDRTRSSSSHQFHRHNDSKAQ